MTVQLIVYLALCWATGIALTFVSRLPWQFEGRLAIGFTVGVSAAAMLTWLIAIPFGMSRGTVLAGALALVCALGACLRLTAWRPRLRAEVTSMMQRWRHFESLPLLIVLILAALFFIPFYSHALDVRDNGLYAGYVTIWGDWSTHLSLSGYLATARHVLPPENPFFSGTNLTYPFLPDLFSGALTYFGPTLLQALPLSSALLSMALVVTLYSVGLRFTGSRWAGALGTAVLLLGGGLGFYRALLPQSASPPPDGNLVRNGICPSTFTAYDLIPRGSGVPGWLQGLGHILAAPPHQYTQDPCLNYQWLNPVLAYLVPQRTTLYGWAIGLLALSLLWYGWRSHSFREMSLAGITLGLLPLFHLGTYVDLLVVVGGFAVLCLLLTLRREGLSASLKEMRSQTGRQAQAFRRWAAFFALALLPGIPQVLLIVPEAAYGQKFIGGVLKFQLGWIASADGYHEPFLQFWLANTALLIPFAVVAFIFLRGTKPAIRMFLLPTWLLFVIPNILVLQPWDWDNTKWFIWWAIPASLLAGMVLTRVGRRGALFAGLATVLFVVQTASGALDLDRASQPDLNSYLFLSSDELNVAAWARDSTPETSVFLTGWKHNHPILTLSQRVEVMGYPGWLWSWGINYAPRQDDVRAMFRGDPATTALLRRYHVDYVVIGPEELQDANPNLAYYQSRYRIVYRSPARTYQVFSVS